MQIDRVGSSRRVLANVLVLSLSLLLGACATRTNKITSDLSANSLQGEGIVVISTSTDSTSMSSASCLGVNAKPANGETGYCLEMDNPFFKSDFADQHGQFYILVLRPGHYSTGLGAMNPYDRYTNPHVGDFDIQAGQILYLGEVHLMHGGSQGNHLEIRDQHDRDIALFHQHDPALADQEVQVQLLVITH